MSLALSRKLLPAVSLSLVVGMMLGCPAAPAVPGPAPSPDVAPTPPAKSPSKDDAETKAGWGSIKGQVVFAGDKVPEPVPIPGPFGNCAPPGPIFSQEWVVNPANKGVRWAVVWLAADDNLKAPAKKMPINPALAKPAVEAVVVDQPACVYEPHLVAMRDDQQLIFKNSGMVAHNVNYNGCGVNGNPILQPGDEHKAAGKLTYTWTPMNVGCNIHGWMKSYVRVFDHPYFAVTDKDGNFEIKNCPEGEWYLIVWQETAGYKEPRFKEVDGKKLVFAGSKVVIKPGETTDVGPIGIGGDKK